MNHPLVMGGVDHPAGSTSTGASTQTAGGTGNGSSAGVSTQVVGETGGLSMSTIGTGTGEVPEHGLLADSLRAELWALGRRRVVEPLATLCLGQRAGAVGRPRAATLA